MHLRPLRETDRGGTFTDCLGAIEGQDDIVVKLLSQDPGNYNDAPIEGIRRILEKATGKIIPRNEKLDVSDLSELSIRMGTTVATNALLERKGERVALLITKGFGDALQIGTQSRPKLFDLNIVRPDVLYEDVVEVDERVTIEEYQQNPLPPDEATLQAKLQSDPELCLGISGEMIRILKRPDRDVLRNDLQKLFDKGYRTIAVCLVHSYTYQGELHLSAAIVPYTDTLQSTNYSSKMLRKRSASRKYLCQVSCCL